MNYQLKFLKKENDLNKLIKSQRKQPETFCLLFVSLWDDLSSSLIESLQEKYGSSEEGIPVYILDSFHTPHSFVIYNTTKLPHLVSHRKRSIKKEDYLSKIYSFFGL
jgi:hypothetical protein